MFACKNLYRDDLPEYYMVNDYDTKCWDTPHLKWALGLSLPSMMIVNILLPLLIIRGIIKSKKRVVDTSKVGQGS